MYAAPVLQLCEVCVEVEVPLLGLAEDLLEEEDVGVGRVDELGVDVRLDHGGHVGQEVAHLLHRVGRLVQSDQKQNVNTIKQKGMGGNGTG